jgi:hypothetical protein
MWLVRALGVLLALVGVGSIRVSRRKDSIPLAIGGPLTLAMSIALSEVIAMANDVLPATFLLDAGMEFCFMVWWLIAIYRGESLIRSRPLSVGK